MPDQVAGVAQARACPAALSVGMTDRGLVLGAGAVLVRRAEGGARPLALDADLHRLLVLLSVAQGAPVEAADVIHHVEAAAGHWQRGDKALANLRLVFSRLPRVTDAGTVACLSLAEEVLDGGMAPDALMNVLWPETTLRALEKYRTDQLRVPPGHGIESGRWTREGWIQVAEADEPDHPSSMLDDLPHGHRDADGAPTTEIGPHHLRLFDPITGIPSGISRPTGTAATISAAAKAAADAVGPDKGPVYGTAVHTEFKERINRLNDPDIHAEKSYKDGALVDYGTPGSIRIDGGVGPVERPHTVYDLKNGAARLTSSRVREMRQHLPDGNKIPIIEVRP